MYTDYDDENESYYSDDDNNNNGQNSDKIKKIAIFILIFVIFIVLVLILAKGCAKKSNNAPNDNSSSAIKNQTPTIMLGRDSLSLDVGEEFELQADVLNTKNTKPIVKWRSDDTSVASVNDDGIIKAEGEGTTAIIVSYTENGKTYTNACVVKVTKNTVTLESIKLTQKEIKLKIGKMFLIEVNVVPSDAKVDKFLFESSDSKIAKVDEKGYITAISVGTATITVKTQDSSISETMLVNVSDDSKTVTEIEPTGIEIVGFTNGLTIGKTTQAIANITPNSATNKNVTWRSSNEGIAKVDANGVVTGVSAGTCTIMASTANNITASKEITVSPNTISVDKITINGATSITMKVGGTKYLYYTISPSNASNQKVTYKSSNPAVVYVDSNGIMAGVGVGTAIVTITTQDGGKTAVANVTVTAAKASGTSSSSSTSSNTEFSTESFDTYLYGSDGTDNISYNYTTDSSIYSYSSSDNESNNCNADGIVMVTHNESKNIYSDNYAVVSTYSFNNTKPFIRTGQLPTLEVVEIGCAEDLTYGIYYGKTIDKVSDSLSNSGKITKVGNKIKLGNKDGYYKIVISGKNDNVTLTKTYYAYVQTGSSNDFIDVTSTEITSGRKITISRNDSKVSRIYYCISKTNDECTPSKQVKTGLNSIKTIYYSNFTISSKAKTSSFKRGNGNIVNSYTGQKICFNGYNGNILVGKKICVEI